MAEEVMGMQSIAPASNVSEDYVRAQKLVCSRSNIQAPLMVDLLIERGAAMPMIQHPLTGKKKLGRCYQNCFELVMRYPELTYCEGMASYMIPMEHAWVMTPEGEFFDPTWKRIEGQHYFGVAFKFKELAELMLKSKVHGVLCNLHLLGKTPQEVQSLLRKATYERSELPI